MLPSRYQQALPLPARLQDPHDEVQDTMDSLMCPSGLVWHRGAGPLHYDRLPCQTCVSPGVAEGADSADWGRKVVGSHRSPGRKSSPPRMAARVRGVAARWSRLQPVRNVETDITTVNRAKSVANTRPRYASGTLSCKSVELNTQRMFAAMVARNRAAAASHSVGI